MISVEVIRTGKRAKATVSVFLYIPETSCLS